MTRPIFFTNMLKRLFPLYFKVASLARRVPIVERLIHHMFFKGDSSFFIPHDRHIKINETAASPEQIALPSQVVEHFVRKAKHIFIMDQCACRDAEGCTNHPHDLGCVFLGEAVLHISPKLGRLASVDETLAHLQNGKDEGLVHMIGRNRIDAIWTGAEPRDKLMTICSCCSCCCLFRIVTRMPESIGSLVSKMKGVQVAVTDRCTGCGKCVKAGCFVEALSMVDGKASIAHTCRGCGRCVDACPTGAIELTVDDPAYGIKTVRHMNALVDVSGSGASVARVLRVEREPVSGS